MKTWFYVVLAGLVAAPGFAQSASEAIRGFTAEGAKTQRALEAKMGAVPRAENVREYIRVMSEEPHHTGSKASEDVAHYVLDKFKSWGLDAEFHKFEGLMPTPRERHLKLLEPESYVATLKEPAIPEDKDSSDEGQLPTYNAYSPDGDVTAQIVYVNYGMPDDYEKLDKLGIDVKGKIVLARYQGGWRGIKPKVAAEHGAIGCIIYSDPRDDGYFQGDPYPGGPFRSKWSVQRGSTMDMPIHPGDPLTPGWGSEPGGRRLKISEAKTLPTIPVLPISWGDALPILRNIGGPVAPENWRGSLPLTYHVGPGPAKVHLKVAFNWTIPTGYNVIAKIPGSEYPDEWIMYGNHHDGWVNGAMDPVSGNAALMETARTLAEMVKQGWRPKRTIIFASWDAEEWGLIGSTEWGEKYADEIRAKTVAYFNTDSNRAGTLSFAGSHTLERFLNEVAKSITDPNSGRDAWTVMKEKAVEEAGEDDNKKKELDTRRDLRIGALGSGSDYTVFLDHLAVASVNTAFRDDVFGTYHSIYDSFDWYEKFGDPQFAYGRAMAEVHAIALTRMADAQVLPFEFTNFADTIGVYLKELDELLKKKRKKDASITLDLKPLQGGLDEITKAAEAYEKAFEQSLSGGGAQGDFSKANAVLRQVEQAMRLDNGLPGKREWFKHSLYAPGFYTGYGVKTIPGVRESIEQDDWATARTQVGVVRGVFDKVAARIREAEKALRAAM
ncbi:MAG: M28 family metallopeptidase [Acidobacteria bacterium]|nr:M28 family metallopeptidase [Acidobacteriota bacterium]